MNRIPRWLPGHRHRQQREMRQHIACLTATAERWRQEAAFWRAIAATFIHAQHAIEICDRVEADCTAATARLRAAIDCIDQSTGRN